MYDTYIVIPFCNSQNLNAGSGSLVFIENDCKSLVIKNQKYA